MAWKPDYVSAADLAAYVRITDNLDDAQLARAVTAASRAIDRHTRRQFGKTNTAEARYYSARWATRLGAWVVPIDDLMTTTGLVVELDTTGDGTYATEIASGTYVLRPRNAAADGEPWTELALLSSASASPCGADGELRITATWGWTSVPVTVEEACLLQASRLDFRRNAPAGVAGSPDAGSEIRLLAKLDPDVAVTLEPYRRKARPR